MTSGLPAEFIERLGRIVASDDLPLVLESFAITKPIFARLNPLRAAPDETFAELELAGFSPRRVAGHETALRFEPSCRDDLMRSAAVNEGRLYPQSLSSQCAAPLLDPVGAEWVLDLAAAPGGKTLHLAALMNNEGRLSAVEPIRPRMYRLAENLKRGGATHVKTYLMDGRAVERKTPDRFDRVLLDAPCSSESRMRIGDEESLRYWSPRKIGEQSRKQLGLLSAALRACRPGGRVLYSTCSLAPEENERIVDQAIRRFDGEIEILPFTIPSVIQRAGLTAWEGEAFMPELANTCRILPSSEVDAFFLALLQRHS